MQTKNILIVDDSQVNSDLLKVFLKNDTWALHFAMNGREALDKCKNNCYDIILMDIHMPEMNGYQATRAIRALEHYRQKAIIAVTADVTQENKKKCFEAGCTEYITKPIERERIREVVMNFS